MPFYQRKRIRLLGLDYTQPNAYFITICTQNRVSLFGHINSKRMILNEAGQLIHTTWHKIEDRFSIVSLDKFVTMPNHIHGILWINLSTVEDNTSGTVSISDVIHWFKTKTTFDYGQEVLDSGWAPYDKKLWQRSFYDRIIRDTEELHRTRRYIRNNPVRWSLDKYYLD